MSLSLLLLLHSHQFPMVIRQGIQKAVETAVEAIGSLSQKIETKEEIAQVAAVSCDDPKIGELIAEAMEVVGKEGVITVEDHCLSQYSSCCGTVAGNVVCLCGYFF